MFIVPFAGINDSGETNPWWIILLYLIMLYCVSIFIQAIYIYSQMGRVVKITQRLGAVLLMTVFPISAILSYKTWDLLTPVPYLLLATQVLGSAWLWRLISSNERDLQTLIEMQKTGNAQYSVEMSQTDYKKLGLFIFFTPLIIFILGIVALLIVVVVATFISHGRLDIHTTPWLNSIYSIPGSLSVWSLIPCLVIGVVMVKKSKHRNVSSVRYE